MKRFQRSHLAAVAVVAFVAALGSAALWPGDRAPVAAAGPPPAVMSLMQFGQEPLHTIAQAQPVAPTPRVSVVPTSKSQQVAALEASPNPKDNYAAYKMLRACLDADNAEKAEACGDISPGQLTAEARLQPLYAAALAGLWGTFTDVNREGPSGMAEWLGKNWGTPQADVMAEQFQPLHKQILMASLASGDPQALYEGMQAVLKNCREGVECAQKAVAVAYVLDHVTKEYPHKQFTGRIEGLVAPERRELSPPQLMEAEQLGRTMLASVKSSPYYGSN